MSAPILVYVLKRQERMGRLKTRRLGSVQQVMDELEKLGIDPIAARSRLLDLNGIERFYSPAYGLVTVEYPVEWELPERMKANPRPPAASDFVRAAISNVKKVNKTFLHLVRPAGSYVEGQTRSKTDTAGAEDVAKFLKSLRWVEVTDAVRAKGAGYGQVRYYRAQVPPGVAAYESVLLWGELSPAERERVQVVQAFHQNAKPTDPVRYELVSDIPARRVKEIHIMVGDPNNPMKAPTRRSAFAFTWYPGRITPFVNSDLSNFPNNIHPMATVKAAEGIMAKRNPTLRHNYSFGSDLLVWGDWSRSKYGEKEMRAERGTVTYVITKFGPEYNVTREQQGLSGYAAGSRSTVSDAKELAEQDYSALMRAYPTLHKNPYSAASSATFTIWKDGVAASRRPVDYVSMSDYLVFSAGFGGKGQRMLDELVSGKRDSIAFKLRGQNYEVTLAGKGRSGGQGGAPAALRRNPSLNWNKVSDPNFAETYVAAYPDARLASTEYGALSIMYLLGRPEGQARFEVFRKHAGGDWVALRNARDASMGKTVAEDDLTRLLVALSMLRQNPSALAPGFKYRGFKVVAVHPDHVVVERAGKGDGPEHYEVGGASKYAVCKHLDEMLAAETMFRSMRDMPYFE